MFLITYQWPCLFHVALFEIVSCYLWYQLPEKFKGKTTSQTSSGQTFITIFSLISHLLLASSSLPVGYAVLRYA